MTNEECKFIFTQGQKMRMRSLFEMGALRSAIGSRPINLVMAPAPTSFDTDYNGLCEAKALSNADEWIHALVLSDRFFTQTTTSGASQTRGYTRSTPLHTVLRPQKPHASKLFLLPLFKSYNLFFDLF
jgi:hypothetical protein